METALSISGRIKTADGNDLYYTEDIPHEPKAIIVIVHGFGEHSGRYEYVKDKLNEFGYGVYRFDNRGHGKSGGERGHLKNFNYLICDANALVDLAKEEFSDLPIFMLGHSMGGFITAAYGIKHQDKLKGQILSGAATLEPIQMKGLRGEFLKLLNNITPNMKIKNRLSKLLSKDQEIVKDYEEDELNLKEATLQFYVEFLINGIGWLKENMHYYKYPCLILHGGDDKIVYKEASENFYNSISSTDKQLKIYEGLYHEIFNENERDMVINDIVNWLEERI